MLFKISCVLFFSVLVLCSVANAKKPDQLQGTTWLDGNGGELEFGESHMAYYKIKTADRPRLFKGSWAFESEVITISLKEWSRQYGTSGNAVPKMKLEAKFEGGVLHQTTYQWSDFPPETGLDKLWTKKIENAKLSPDTATYKHSDVRLAVKRAIADGDNNEAIRLLVPFAERNDAYAQGTLGERYYSINEYKNALKWFKNALKNGDVGSGYNLGAMYEQGKGVNADFNKAFSYYKKAASKGSLYALNRLGEIKYKGVGNTQIDTGEALKLWSRAADSNFIPAMSNMCRYAPRYMLSGPNKMYCAGE